MLTSPAMRLLRYLWAGPASCLGLLLAALDNPFEREAYAQDDAGVFDRSY